MKYVLGGLALCSFFFLNAFTNNNGNADNVRVGDSTKLVTKGPMGYKSYLGCSTSIDGGTVDKGTIIELLKLPLCVRDKNGETYSVKEYLLTYSERGVFQDSTGLPSIMVDYTTIQIDSNQLDQSILKSLSDRLYKGDTLTFSDVYINRNNGLLLINSSMKVVVK